MLRYCKIGAPKIIPASFFVSVAYNCWAFRRQGAEINPVSGKNHEMAYECGSDVAMEQRGKNDAGNTNETTDQPTSREMVLQTPVSEEEFVIFG